MRYPQVVVYERDGRLARLLREASQPPRVPAGLKPEAASWLRTWSGGLAFWLREARRADRCLRLLRYGRPSVLVLKVECNLSRRPARTKPAEDPEQFRERLLRDQVRRLGLLEQVSLCLPNTAVVVVGDAENDALVELAWDLGASYVLFPPQPLPLLPGIVAGLLQTAPEVPSGEGGRTRE